MVLSCWVNRDPQEGERRVPGSSLPCDAKVPRTSNAQVGEWALCCLNANALSSEQKHIGFIWNAGCGQDRTPGKARVNSNIDSTSPSPTCHVPSSAAKDHLFIYLQSCYNILFFEELSEPPAIPLALPPQQSTRESCVRAHCSAPRCGPEDELRSPGSKQKLLLI